MGWLEMATDLAKEFEGCELKAYPDPAKGWLVPTVGYGATGYGIGKDTVWTQQQADADLDNRMRAIGSQIDSLVTVPLNDEPKAALCDFGYNVGLTALSNSTLLRKLNAGDMQGAADEFPKWTHAGNVTLPGLVKRRDAERALFLLGS